LTVTTVHYSEEFNNQLTQLHGIKLKRSITDWHLLQENFNFENFIIANALAFPDVNM